jgi:hypothetical protein
MGIVTLAHPYKLNHDFRFTNAYTFSWSMDLPNHHWTWIIIGLIISWLAVCHMEYENV